MYTCSETNSNIDGYNLYTPSKIPYIDWENYGSAWMLNKLDKMKTKKQIDNDDHNSEKDQETNIFTNECKQEPDH